MIKHFFIHNVKTLSIVYPFFQNEYSCMSGGFARKNINIFIFSISCKNNKIINEKQQLYLFQFQFLFIKYFDVFFLFNKNEFIFLVSKTPTSRVTSWEGGGGVKKNPIMH